MNSNFIFIFWGKPHVAGKAYVKNKVRESTIKIFSPLSHKADDTIYKQNFYLSGRHRCNDRSDDEFRSLGSKFCA